MANDLLRATPIELYPLALTAINAGTMLQAWPVAIPSATAVAFNRVHDVTASVCLLLLLLALLRSVQLGCKRLLVKIAGHFGHYSTGGMALFGVANWSRMRGAPTVGLLLWSLALAIMLSLQVWCLWVFCRKLSPKGTRREALRTLLVPASVIPYVGIAAATCTGGMQPFPPAARGFFLYGPLALTAGWGLLLVPPLWIAGVSKGCSKPPAASHAILMAPAAIVLFGWLIAIGDAQAKYPAIGGALAVLSLVGMSIVTPSLPRILLRRPFAAAIASCGFPAEIAAMALVRYYAAACPAGEQPASGVCSLLFGLAWAQLVVASLVVIIVAVRFVGAAAATVRRVACPPPNALESLPPAIFESFAPDCHDENGEIL